MHRSGNIIKSTFKHAVIYSGAGIIGKAIGFLMLPVYAHYLRGEGYGILGMIDVLLSVLVLLIGYGISGAMERFYFEKSTEKERNILVSTTLFVMFFLVIFVSTPALLFVKPIAKLAFGKAEYSYFVLIAILSFIFEMTGKTAESYLLIKQRSVFVSAIALARLLLGLFLNIYLIVNLQMGVLGYLYSGLVCALIFSLFNHLYAFLKVGFNFRKSDARDILKFSIPLLPGYVAMFIKNNANRVILRGYMGLAELGTFEMLFKFASLIGILVMEPFHKIWSVKRFEICDENGGANTMARVFTLYLSILCLMGLMLSLEVPIALKILTPDEFWVGTSIVVLAVASRILLASYYHFFFGLLYVKKTHLISLIQFITTAVNVVGSFILIKPFGILGAVLVSCITSLSQCILGYIWGQKYYFIPFEWANIIKVTSLACVLFVIVNQASVSMLGIGAWLNQTIAPVIRDTLDALHLDAIRHGKLVEYVLGNFPLVVEGGIKFLLGLLFIPGLVLLGIIPRSFMSKAFSLQTVKNPFTLMSSVK